MKTRKRKRVMALLICLCMVLTMLPMTGMAVAAEACPSHPAHDDTCGFVQAVEGHECGHTHDDKCGYTEATEGMPCKHEQGEHDEGCGYTSSTDEIACAHQKHDGNCGYVEAKESMPCNHAHNADCGYTEAVEGNLCGHVHGESCGDQAVQNFSITEKTTDASALSQENGYTFDSVSRALTITSADGLTAWPNDSEIKRLGGKAAIGSLSISGVTEIPQGVFSDCDNMTSVALGDGLLTIEEGAFRNCGLLETLTLPNSLKKIGNNAFERCTKMNTRLPDGLESIGNAAFMSCSALSLTALPRGLTSLGGGAFNGCTSLAVTALPDKITAIGQGCFMDCKSLTQMELPAGLTKIEVNAFKNCSKLSALTFLGKKAPELQIHAVQFPTPFQGVAGAGVLRYPAGADYSAVKAALPDGWTEQEIDASAIESVVVSPSAVTLQKGTSLRFSASVQGKDSPSQQVNWSLSPSDGGSVINQDGLLTVAAGETAESLTVTAASVVNPEKSGSAAVTVTDDSVLFTISGVIQADKTWAGLAGIPVTLWLEGKKTVETTTDTQGRYICENLPQGDYVVRAGGYTSTKVYYAEQSAFAALLGGDQTCDLVLTQSEPPLPSLGTFVYGDLRYDIISESPKEVSVRGWSGSAIELLRIPSMVEHGGENYDVVQIGDGAFFLDTILDTLKLPQNGKLRRIGREAFWGAALVHNFADRSLTIPASVTHIDDGAFAGCGVPLLKFSENSSLTVIGNEAFYRSAVRDTLTIPAGVTRIGDGAFANTYIAGTLTIPASVTYIGDAAFSECQLTGLVLPEQGSLSIGRAAFRGREDREKRLTGTLTIPASVTSIGKEAFADTNLSRVDFSAFAGTLGQSVFLNSPVTELDFNQNPAPTYSADAFSGMPSHGVVRYPAGAEGYTPADFAGGALKNWSFINRGGSAAKPYMPLNFSVYLDPNPNPEVGRTVILTWTAPSNGGSPITNYQVSADNGRTWDTIGPAVPTHRFYKLEDGVYTFQVRAVNAVGAGAAASMTYEVGTGNTVPTAPQNFTANPGDKQIALSWDAPASNGGAEITKYEVSKEGGTSWMDASGTTGHTFTNLTNGQSYTFQVRAVNSVGAGAVTSTTATPRAEGPETFTLTVENGTDITAAGSYEAGEEVAIKADEPEKGKIFLQWTSSGGGSFTDAFNPETTFTMPAGNVTVTAEYTDDTPAPTGEITVAVNSWKEFLNKLTFGKFFKETQEVTINSSGLGSVTVEYFTTSEDLSEETVKSKSDGWQPYHSSFYLEPNADVVVYARITNNGKTVYLRSDRIVLDKTSPVFSLTDGKTYSGAQTLTVSDNYALDSVKLGGKEQLPEDFTGKEKALPLNTNGVYTITAQDKAGNAASITVTITDITAEQVTAPAFNPAGGTYDSPQSVEITCATEGAEIYYTTDGSDPTAGSTKYTGAIGVSETMTIKAMAVKSGMADSEITEAAYTIQITPAHAHSWAEEWSNDKDSHWHECTAADCTITENSKKDGYGGHTESGWITTKQPTETEAGSKKKECTVCGYELDTKEIPATGSEHTHVLTQVPQKAATCVETGHTEYYYCEGCGKYFSDSEGATEIQLSDTVIEATGAHTVEGEWQHDGENHWKRCSVCNQEVEKTAHSGGTANCHAKANCEVCGAEHGALAPDNHDGGTEIRNKKEATETEDGYTGDTYCKGCNKVISTGTIIPATGHTHSYAGEWQSDGDGHWKLCEVCGEPGEKTAHSGGTANCHQKADCETCGAKYGSLDPADHDGKTEVRDKKDATETEDGYTGDTYCLGCGKLLEKGKVIPKQEPGHTHEFEGEWQSDSTHHWQLCTAGDGEVGNKAAHTAGDWMDDKKLSENELSKRHQECTVCAYRMATVVTIKTDGAAEIKRDKDGNWTFYGAFKDLIAIRLNGVPMGIEPQSSTSANLTYPGYEGIAGIAKAGSVEVTLYADFLKTLPAGTYTLEAEFAFGKTTGTGSTEFIVSNDNKPEPKPEPADPTNPADPAPKQDTTKPANPSDVPSTGDTRQLWPWMLLMLAALISVSTIVIYKKKKGTNQQK